MKCIIKLDFGLIYIYISYILVNKRKREVEEKNSCGRVRSVVICVILYTMYTVYTIPSIIYIHYNIHRLAHYTNTRLQN